jgi:hypothetical protein
MTAAREELSKDGEHWRGEEYMKREALREAHMRQCIREAIKAGHQRIAVVCGAWHVPALKASVTAKADSALLRACPSQGDGDLGPLDLSQPGQQQRLWRGCDFSGLVPASVAVLSIVPGFGVKSASNA